MVILSTWGYDMEKSLDMTEEEFVLVRSAIMLPLVLGALEHDNKKLKDADLKVPMVYVANNRQLQEYILKDIAQVKKELRNRGIKIFDQGKTPTGYQAKYICRGYRHESSWLSSFIKSIVVVRLSEMMGFPIELIRE